MGCKKYLGEDMLPNTNSLLIAAITLGVFTLANGILAI